MVVVIKFEILVLIDWEGKDFVDVKVNWWLGNYIFLNLSINKKCEK